MNKCFMDTVREKTSLGDYYGEKINVPPLLICNQDNKQRLPTKILNSSVLLQEANIDLGKCYSLTGRNYNDTIYERNLPFNQESNYWSPTVSPSPSDLNDNKILAPQPSMNKGINNNNLPLKIETRPILGGLCGNDKAVKDREDLDEFNSYKPNNSGNSCNMVFVPGKGPINHYFDNIDIESQLKNINEIDTKCSSQLFKVNPNENSNKLHCYKDTLVKNYQKCESKAGYTWCDYVDGIKYEQFPVCQSKEFTCALSQGSRKPEKIKPEKNNLETGQMVDENELNRVQKELYLVQKKRELDEQINTLRNNKKFSVQNKNIEKINSNGIR